MSVPPPRPGFVGSKFVQNQFLALARHTVFRKPILALYGGFLKSTGASAVVPVNDTAKTHTHDDDEDPDLKVDPNTRVLFAVRPPPNIVGGVTGCAWNVALGQLGSPFVALSMFWSTMNNCKHGRYIGALWGVGGGMFWGVCFALLGGISGAQQLAVGAFNQCAGPYYAMLASGSNRRHWSAATSQFIPPRITAQPEVNMWRGNDEMILEAMRRQSNRAKRNQSEKGFESMYDKNGNVKEDKKTIKTRERTYYDILNVHRTATDKEVKEAYAKLAMKLHPDRNSSPNAHEQFDELTKAYRTLGNAEKRKRYDAAGISGSEDLGNKKRTAIRSFFGGDDLAALVGDVRRNNFNRRFVDETDFPMADLAVLNERTEDGCVRELLDKYLAGYPLDPRVAAEYNSKKEGTAVATSTHDLPPMEVLVANYEADRRDWEQRVKKIILKYANVALAKEVMHAVGSQYLLTMQLCSPVVPSELLPSNASGTAAAAAPSSSNATTGATATNASHSTSSRNSSATTDKLFTKPPPIRHTTAASSASSSPTTAAPPIRLNLSGGLVARASLYLTVVMPRFVEQNVSKVTQLFKLNPTTKDPAVIMDFVWRLSVTELQQTAHRVALRALCDVDADALERRRRLSALVELSTILVTSGRKYSTVDKRTMEMMTDSLRDYYSKTGKSQ